MYILLLLYLNIFVSSCRVDIDTINITEYKEHSKKVHKSKEFEKLVNIHKKSYSKIHNTLQFLYFHRQYLKEYEKLMNRSIPYINWEKYSSNITNSIIFRKYFKRTFESQTIYGYAPKHIINILKIDDFKIFTKLLEIGPHGLIHANIKGIINSENSPIDPLFWLHHSYIDKIFNIWLKKNKIGYNGRIEYFGTNSKILENNECYTISNIGDIRLNENKPSFTPRMMNMFDNETYIILQDFLDKSLSLKLSFNLLLLTLVSLIYSIL
jgi:hypothetical protein